MNAIFKREFKSYFKGIMGYLFVGILLIFMGFFATAYNFQGFVPSVVSPVGNLLFIMVFLTPVLTMRIIAEERHSKTDQLLYSLPVSTTEVVLAKFFAMVCVFAIAVAVICVYPFVLTFFGEVNLFINYGCILAFFLAGVCFLSIGMFISSVTGNQIVSAIVTFVVMIFILFSDTLAGLVPSTAIASFIALTVCAVILGLIVYLLTKNLLVGLASATLVEVGLAVVYIIKSELFAGLFAKVFDWISVYSKYTAFSNGSFDLTAVVYYISFTCLFVFFSIQAVEKRRWS